VTSDGRSYWERHAKRYERSTRFLSRPVPRMLELAVEAARGKTRVLEVAAGPGLITTAIAPVVGELIATDYAAAMVRQLGARVRDAGLANVTCEQADIYELHFEDASSMQCAPLTCRTWFPISRERSRVCAAY
jgi:phosphatidylethanolamine/phosphatidyl-N-methylethanolamine N-methyltransferase